MSIIVENFELIKSHIPAHVKLVAVSKFQPVSSMLEIYEQGQRIFGESKVQELVSKYETLPNDIEWHFIGHLQTNKVKYIVPFVTLIHGVDSLRLLQEIDKCGQEINKTIDCLLQMHMAQEETKFGFSAKELEKVLNSSEFNALKNIRICGLMGMASYTDDENQIRKEFRWLAEYFNKIKTSYFCHDDFFNELSMGMSGDYQIAIEEGSTMVRVGSSIFGERKIN